MNHPVGENEGESGDIFSSGDIRARYFLGSKRIQETLSFKQIFIVNGNTGYFRKVYRSLQVRVPHNILKYLSIHKLPQKRSHQSIYPSNSQKKFILCFNFITNLNICKYIL